MNSLKELLYSLGSFCAGIIKTVLDWFLGLSFLNKIIVINTLVSFLAVTLPIAKFYIFESWTGINNPIGVYLIFIVVIMIGTTFFHGIIILAGRVIINLWYLIYLIVMYAGHTISHAPYVISIGFFFNIIAPLIYIGVSILVYLSGDN
jgi:hypothetical protein